MASYMILLISYNYFCSNVKKQPRNNDQFYGNVMFFRKGKRLCVLHTLNFLRWTQIFLYQVVAIDCYFCSTFFNISLKLAIISIRYEAINYYFLAIFWHYHVISCL